MFLRHVNALCQIMRLCCMRAPPQNKSKPCSLQAQLLQMDVVRRSSGLEIVTANICLMPAAPQDYGFAFSCFFRMC